MKTKSIRRNYLYNVTYQCFLLVVSLLTIPYVSRVLGPDNVGQYSFVQSIADLFALAAVLGSATYAMQEVAHVQTDRAAASRVFWEIFLFRLLTALVVCAAYLCVAAFSGRYRVLFWIQSMALAAAVLDISWFFQGLEEFRLTVVRSTAVKGLGMAAIFIFVRTENDLIPYAVINGVAALGGNASLWLALRRRLVRTPVRALRVMRHLKPALGLFAPALAVWMYTLLDKTILGIFSGDAQVGYYTRAEQIVKIALTVITSLGAVLLPRITACLHAGRYDEMRSYIDRAVRFSMMLGMPLALGIASVADKLVPIFLGERFLPSIALLYMLCPLPVLIGTASIIGTPLLLPLGWHARYSRCVIAGAVINMALNLLLVGRFAAMGVAFGTLMAESTVTLLEMRGVRDYLSCRKTASYFIRYGVMALGMAACVRVSARLPLTGVAQLAAMVAVGMAVYALELLLVRDPALAEARRFFK